MAKPQPVRIPSDDCIVTVAGEPYAVHEGEWVEIVPIVTAREMQALSAMATVQDRLAAAQGDADETQQVMTIMNEAFTTVADLLAARIRAWNWTDMSGEPLPSPHGRPDIITGLTTDEMFYLVQLAQGETAATRKNA